MGVVQTVVTEQVVLGWIWSTIWRLMPARLQLLQPRAQKKKTTRWSTNNERLIVRVEASLSSFSSFIHRLFLPVGTASAHAARPGTQDDRKDGRHNRHAKEHLQRFDSVVTQHCDPEKEKAPRGVLTEEETATRGPVATRSTGILC